MSDDHPKPLLRMLNLMRDLEQAAADFYFFCSNADQADPIFWDKIRLDEMKHAEYLDRIIRLVESMPATFKPGLTFGETTIRDGYDLIQRGIARAESGKMSAAELLAFAHDIEQLIVEKNYMQAVESNNETFNKLIKEIVADTMEHRAWIDLKIKKMK